MDSRAKFTGQAGPERRVPPWVKQRIWTICVDLEKLGKARALSRSTLEVFKFFLTELKTYKKLYGHFLGKHRDFVETMVAKYSLFLRQFRKQKK